jgi:hypothetical protein
VAIFMMAAGANASTIDYTTNAAGTQFVSGGSGLTVNSTSGVAATITFIPNTTSGAGVPSNVNFGDFLLTCGGCTTGSTIFGAFTFDLVISDTTDGATGMFVGTSIGGTVTGTSSTVQVNWQSPLTIGPGTTGVLTGNFGNTHFDMVSPITLIVAPNSGSPAGDSTVNGQVGSVTPEPATLGLIGAALIGLGLVRRKKYMRP